MISNLKNFNNILLKSLLLSNPINSSSIYAALKTYNGTDWTRIIFEQPNKYEKMSENILLTHTKPVYDIRSSIKIKNNNCYFAKLIKWYPNYDGHFHSHYGFNCYFKVLSGTIVETVKTENNIIEKNHSENAISYIHDSIGEHKITNNSNENAYSIHIYYKNNNS